MLVIGLTGGIGAGKTTVLQYFKLLGIDVFDSDQIARQLVRKGLPAFECIVQHFGEKIVNSEGELNRSLMRRLIFSDADERGWLEELLHPLVYKELFGRVQSSNSTYAVVEIPLLMESLRPAWVDRVLLVDSFVTERIKRVVHRDALPVEGVRAIMAQQMHADERRKLADDTLENHHAKADLQQQVQNLHSFYLDLASAQCMKSDQ